MNIFAFFAFFAALREKIYLSLLLLLNLAGLPAAQEGIELTLLGGHNWGGSYNISPGRIKFDNGPTAGFVIDIPVKETPGLMAEASYFQVRSSLRYQEQPFEPMTQLFDMTVHYFQAGGLYQENVGAFVPFGTAAIGAALFDPHNNNYVSEWLFTASLGFGAKYAVSTHWGIRAQARLIAPVQLEAGSLWCQSGSGCIITLKSGTVLLQADMMVGLIYLF